MNINLKSFPLSSSLKGVFESREISVLADKWCQKRDYVEEHAGPLRGNLDPKADPVRLEEVLLALVDDWVPPVGDEHRVVQGSTHEDKLENDGLLGHREDCCLLCCLY